jgi:hypothetical protein
MCVSTMCGLFLGQRGLVEWPCDPSMSPTRDASDRLLPSHVSTYEYPRLVGSRCVERLRARATGKKSPGSHQSDSLRWAARPCFWFIAMGVLLPVVTRADRTSDIPVASSAGARPLAWCGDRRRPPRPFLARSRERYELVNDPGCLPSGKDPRPATPSRAPGSGLRWTRGLATVIPDLAASFAPGDSCEPSGGQVPVHAPRCQRETRFSGPRRRLPTSAT